MLKNYFKTALAHLIKNKSYSLISVFSLSMGLAVCILLLVYVQNELSYDRYHEKADNIYRLCQEEHPYQSPMTAKILADNFPEIKYHTRILPRDNIIFEYKGQRFKENEVAYVDADFFRIFSFKFTSGIAETALQQPGTIVISEKTAQKYFGNQNPIGKVFRLGNEYDYNIMGVFEDMPNNSHFRFDIFVTLSDANTVYGEDWMSNWGWLNFLVYFQMHDEFSKSDFETKSGQLIGEYDTTEKDGPLPKYSLQQLKDIHLYSSHIENDIQPQNSISYVLIFSAIGILILLIACFNYINLLTANASTRVTEIGVRKVFGASRNQLAWQYFSESFIILLISLIISLFVVLLSLPIFNELSGKALSLISLTHRNTILGITGIMLFVGIMAGWYPAFILSSSQPIKVLKALKGSGRSKVQFRKILVGAQFTIVIALIASAIVMFRQIHFMQQKELGFDKEYVIVSELDDFGDLEKYNSLKQALLDHSLVLNVSEASRVPSGSLSNYGMVMPTGQTEWITIPYVHMNFDYFNTLGIKASQGRLFSNQLKTDATEAVILNEAAVSSLGIQGDPIGQMLKCNWPKSDREIVGVLSDFHFESLYEQIKPAVFVIDHGMCYQLMVKIKPSNDANSISSISEICQSFYPDQIFDFRFLDERYEQIYQSDTKTFHLMGYFTALAIFIACIGLFGVASFVLTRRTKEIGIRKVNGALVSEIVLLLNKDFVRWIFAAFVIATPIAYYGLNKWLESFAYKSPLSWWVFVLAGLITLGIAILTVSWKTYKAAIGNPVEALKYS